MFHHWFSSKKKVIVDKRLPNQSTAQSMSNQNINLGCSWFPHPVSNAVALMNFSESTLNKKMTGIMPIEDINP